MRRKPVAMSPHRILLTVIVTALVLATSSGSAPRKSSQDQYEQRDDQAQTETNGHKPLIHRVQLTSTGTHQLSLLPRYNPQEKSEKQEIQVGCGDGSVKVPQPTNDEPNVISQKRNKRDTPRQKRDYVHWIRPSQPLQQAPYPNFAAQPVWNFQTASFPNYRVYLPIWGDPRAIPVFFPHRVVLYNPGYPQHNKPSIVSPTEVPPVDNAISTDKPTIGNLPNRFGDPNREEGVAWGFVESEEEVGGGAPSRPTERPSTRRPDINRDPNDLQQITTTRAPPTRPTRPTTTTTTTEAPGRQLPRCVWAIISCCNPSNDQIRYNCFENLGCPGAFWDRNPCSREVTQAAFDAAQEFYDQYDQS